MSVLERRLQILLDQDRYDRLAAEAKRSGRSVAAVIREAIDVHLAPDEAVRRADAAARLLELAHRAHHGATGPEPEPGELKAAYEAELEEKWERLGL